MNDVWGTGGGKGLPGRARAGLEGLSRTRPVAADAYRRKIIDTGSEEIGHVVQTC